MSRLIWACRSLFTLMPTTAMTYRFLAPLLSAQFMMAPTGRPRAMRNFCKIYVHDFRNWLVQSVPLSSCLLPDQSNRPSSTSLTCTREAAKLPLVHFVFLCTTCSLPQSAANPQSPIRNPQSAIRNPSPRPTQGLSPAAAACEQLPALAPSPATPCHSSLPGRKKRDRTSLAN